MVFYAFLRITEKEEKEEESLKKEGGGDVKHVFSFTRPKCGLQLTNMTNFSNKQCSIFILVC